MNGLKAVKHFTCLGYDPVKLDTSPAAVKGLRMEQCTGSGPTSLIPSILSHSAVLNAAPVLSRGSVPPLLPTALGLFVLGVLAMCLKQSDVQECVGGTGLGTLHPSSSYLATFSNPLA